MQLLRSSSSFGHVWEALATKEVFLGKGCDVIDSTSEEEMTLTLASNRFAGVL